MKAHAPRVVVVTGATAGVGRAVVRELANEGASIGLVARGREGLAATAAEVRARGGRALELSCDVADPDAVRAAARAVVDAFGTIDVWINNAMTTVFSPVRETTPAEYRRVMEVIYLGYVHGTLAALEVMRENDRGVILQIGSALARRSIPLQSAYCAAKHAVDGFTESLRTELLHEGSAVHVCQVHLPAMNTPQFRWSLSRMPREAQPVPPIFQPEVAARAIVHVSHHPRRTFLVGGPTVVALLADAIAPGLADRYLGARGWDAQMTDEPRDATRPANLFRPVEGDFGAHGVFDARSRGVSVQAWANRRRRPLAALALGALALVSLAFARRTASSRRR